MARWTVDGTQGKLFWCQPHFYWLGRFINIPTDNFFLLSVGGLPDLSLPIGNTIYTSFLSTLYFTKKYQIWIYQGFTVHKFLLIFSICIVLWLYWYIILSLILYHCSSKNIIDQMLHGKYSLITTSSTSVKVLVFSFCFKDFICISLVPKDISPLEYDFYY